MDGLFPKMKKKTKDSIDETEYLLSSPANARHLARSLAQLNEGKGIERNLIDVDADDDKTGVAASDKALKD